jgi:hypothetical protein
MLDVTREIEIQYYSGGLKTVVVAWPEDADWKRRAKQIRIKQESAGRDKTRSTTIGAEPAALELLAKIRRDGGGDLDAADALEVIDRLEHCELEEGEDGSPAVDMTGDAIRVQMAAMRDRGRAHFRGLVHLVKHPSMRQIRDYKLGCTDLTAVRRGTEMVQPLAAGETLYDQIVQRTEGYAGPVPVIHKDFVVLAILGAISDLEEGA